MSMATFRTRVNQKSMKKRRKKQVMFEASEPWIEWVDGLASTVGMSRSQLIDQAIRRVAKLENYGPLPPKR